MEYCEKGKLSKLLKSTQLSNWATRISILKQIANGINNLHQSKIIHRDIKSKNILVKPSEANQSDFQIKIGVAEMKYSLNTFSIDKNFVGTAAWTSPGLKLRFIDDFSNLIKINFSLETLTTGEYSIYSDVFAFGVLMWEIAARNSNPFGEEADWLKIATKIKQGKRPLIPSDCPIADLIEACWKQEANQRSTMSEIVERFEKIQLGNSTPLKPLSSNPTLQVTNSVQPKYFSIKSRNFFISQKKYFPQKQENEFKSMISFPHQNPKCKNIRINRIFTSC